MGSIRSDAMLAEGRLMAGTAVPKRTLKRFFNITLDARINVVKHILSAVAIASAGYISLLVESQVIYLNRVVLTWGQDVNQPQQWGFLLNQATPFYLKTPDNQTLHAWHILPPGLYHKHESELLAEPSGAAPEITSRLSFKLLHDDPDALLVLYFHGAAGTLGSGWRPPSYRAISSLAPDRIHTVAIDYRGFGQSSGTPSEAGLLIDAHTLLRWATEEAQIPLDRIVFFAQSMGTAVALSLAHDLAVSGPEPVAPKGMVLVAPFTTAADLTRTYSIAGMVPLLAPVARFPAVYTFFKSALVAEWPSARYLARLIARVWAATGAARYHFTIIHAMDDWDIPWSHSEALFWGAVEAASDGEADSERTKSSIEDSAVALGCGGHRQEWSTARGALRKEIVAHGLHDRFMSNPVVSRAIWAAFQGDSLQTATPIYHRCRNTYHTYFVLK